VTVEDAGAGVACRDVGVSYDGAVAVDGVTLAVRAGEMVALLGPSGSGKTTLLSAIAGFLPVSAGVIEIDGRVVASAGRHVPTESRDLGFVFQAHALWPHLSALDTVAYPLRRQGTGRDAARREASALLERLGIAALASRRPAELSGGEQQRVGLGRALARRARVLLLDEPTANLDAALRATLQDEIADRRRESGAAALYATHDSAEALALADRVALMRAGRIVQVAPPRDVYERPADRWVAGLTGAVSVLHAEIEDRTPTHAAVRIGDQTAHAVEVDGVRERPAMTLVRPDWARLGGPLDAVVESVAYRGSHSDVRLSTHAGSIVVRDPGPPCVAPGDRVGWTLMRVWLVPAG
jgi:ABC-type Fe3+/spermidine/putrescine transport system ATPase subunit